MVLSVESSLLFLTEEDLWWGEKPINWSSIYPKPARCLIGCLAFALRLIKTFLEAEQKEENELLIYIYIMKITR